jgi:hypothetical protein
LEEVAVFILVQIVNIQELEAHNLQVVSQALRLMVLAVVTKMDHLVKGVLILQQDTAQVVAEAIMAADQVVLKEQVEEVVIQLLLLLV